MSRQDWKRRDRNFCLNGIITSSTNKRQGTFILKINIALLVFFQLWEIVSYLGIRYTNHTHDHASTVRPTVVAWSMCLSVRHNRETYKRMNRLRRCLQYGLWTWVSTRNRVFSGGPESRISLKEGALYSRWQQRCGLLQSLLHISSIIRRFFIMYCYFHSPIVSQTSKTQLV